MKQPVIQIEELYFSYKKQPVLENINLNIYNLEFLALIGPNGGGKTTLLKLIIGLLKPDNGLIRINGQSPGKILNRIGYVPQNIYAKNNFPISVIDIVLMGRRKPGRRYWLREDRIQAQNLLENIGIGDYASRQLQELSGGQRQRVFIARALAGDPEILLLDEPTSGVDSAGQTEFYELLKKLNKTITIILVSHDIMTLSSYVKSVACVNKRLHYHGEAEITNQMIDMYHCPVDIIAHGIPHRVFKKH